MKDKIIWINNLKVFGILAVVLGHIASPFGHFIFSWHMPLFFILSGFFIDTKISFIDFVSKNFKRLMIPYFIFAFIGLFVEILKRYFLHRESLNIFNEIKNILIWMDMTSLINSYAFVLWFLPALFISRIIVFLIIKKLDILLQLLVVISLFYISFFVELPFAIDNAFNALIFVYIGYLYFQKYKNNKFLFLLPIVFLIIYSIFGILSLDMANKNYESPFINILFSISIIYIFILIFKKINFDNKLLNIWGGNTMFLFIIHPYTNNIAHIIVQYYCKVQNINFELMSFWYIKFIISLILLQFLLFLKLNFENRSIFKYV